MFNFNTGKKQNEPTLNTAVFGGTSASQKTTASNGEGDAYIDSRIKEVELQRLEFMKKNPEFDMKSELQNPSFKQYLWGNNLSVEDAYFLAHRDEIVTEAVKEALTRRDARKNRISENGAGKNSPAVVKKNPKEMSDKEIDAIIERVQNGEKISF